MERAHTKWAARWVLDLWPLHHDCVCLDAKDRTARERKGYSCQWTLPEVNGSDQAIVAPLACLRNQNALYHRPMVKLGASQNARCGRVLSWEWSFEARVLRRLRGKWLSEGIDDRTRCWRYDEHARKRDYNKQRKTVLLRKLAQSSSLLTPLQESICCKHGELFTAVTCCKWQARHLLPCRVRKARQVDLLCRAQKVAIALGRSVEFLQTWYVPEW